VPESVIVELQTCVKTHVRDLRTYAHEARFYATVTEDGGIQRIKMHSSTLHHGEIESCMTRALTALPIPSSVFRMRATMSVSGGESMRHSREPLGVVNTAGALVVLGPIIILAAGVTLGVYIIAVTAEETIEAAKRRRNKVEEMCMDRLYECVASPWQPSWNRKKFGDYKQCEACLFACRRAAEWPVQKCPPPGTPAPN
jgi:hypothetical protein